MKLRLTKFQMVLECLSVALLAAMWIWIITSWDSLPERIPGHYNAAGIVDRLGSKSEIWFVPIVSMVLYGLLTSVSFFPAVWNVPVKITEQNREFVYGNLKTLLGCLKLEIMLIFSYILYSNIKSNSLGVWFFPVFLALVFGTVIFFVLRISRKKYQ